VSERSYLNPVFPTLAPFTALTLPAGSKNDMKPVKKAHLKEEDQKVVYSGGDWWGLKPLP